MPFAIWITGLPGSGKSTIAKELMKHLKGADYLRLDEIRKKFIKDPKFTDEEREHVYSKFVDEGVRSLEKGKNVVLDATGHKLAWRQAARKKINNFIEVHVTCSLQGCINRETAREGGLVTANLYKKSLERQQTGKLYLDVGQVVGVDVPYEENKNAEIVIDSEKFVPEEAANLILNEIKKRGWM